MSELTGARCAGLWQLFDSTDRIDHRLARLYCLECPALALCKSYTQQVKRDAHHASGPALVGTWAGKLYGARGFRPPIRGTECGEPGGYDRHRYQNTRPCEPCKQAKRDYERARTSRKGAA